MTFYDAVLVTEREILVMATSSKFFAREFAVSEAAKALGYELRDNLKHFKQTKHCSLHGVRWQNQFVGAIMPQFYESSSTCFIK